MELGKAVNTWQQAVTKPYKFFSKFKAKPDLSTAVKWAALGGVVSILLNEIMLLRYGQTDIVSAVIGTLVGGAIIAPIMLLISSGILLLFAKLLGGKGNYKNQTYAAAFVQVPIAIVSGAVSLVFDLLVAPTSFMFGSPVRTHDLAGGIFFAISFAILIYGIYMLVLAFRNVHKYSTMRAIATLLIPGVLLVILVVLVLLFFTVAGFSTTAV